MIARLEVTRGKQTEYPLAERTRRGWQNGVTFYPDSEVTKVTPLVVRPTSLGDDIGDGHAWHEHIGPYCMPSAIPSSVELEHPWEDAKVGELWALTIDGFGTDVWWRGKHEWRIVAPGINGSVSPANAIKPKAGHRIWPEDAS